MSEQKHRNGPSERWWELQGAQTGTELTTNGWCQEAALRIDELVAEGETEAPTVVTRDHLDAGSVASPNRETEPMKGGTDAVVESAKRVFATGSGMGAVRHADAGSETAIDEADRSNVAIPMRDRS